MTTETDAEPHHTSSRTLARAVTEVFAPAVWAAAMPLVIALRASPTIGQGLAWAGLAILFSSAIPYGIIWLGVRRGRLTDHHIGRREQRRVPLLLGLASVVVGLVLLVALAAPRELVAMVVVMLAVLLATTIVNQFWKLSAHAAVSAGSVAVLVLAFGPWSALAAVLVVVISWSRVRLADHTAAQTVAGACLGALVAGVVFSLIR